VASALVLAAACVGSPQALNVRSALRSAGCGCAACSCPASRRPASRP